MSSSPSSVLITAVLCRPSPSRASTRGATSRPIPPGVSFTPTDYAYRFDGTPEPEHEGGAEGPRRRVSEDLHLREKSPPSSPRPILGVGGAITPGKSYFPEAVALVHKHGGLYICDEVQTGVGRTGEHFFGIAHQDAKPDIIVSWRRGSGNGYPIGAVITTPEIAASVKGMLPLQHLRRRAHGDGGRKPRGARRDREREGSTPTTRKGSATA